jgi:bifunctional UDP-N-acetylglucosamine pyrophosphorylase/glucosamine-1-phosphate N-acetyltransferase
VSILSFDVPAPHQYGRIVRDAAGRVTAIVESKNCTPAQASIREANSGIMVLSLAWARSALPRVTPNPLTNEYYLTDLVAMAVAEFGIGSVRALHAADPNDAWGVNDRVQLAAAEAMLLARTCQALMASGVTIPHPNQVSIAPEVAIAPDSVILPGSVLTGQTIIGTQCIIGPQTSIDDSTIGAGCHVPHASIKHSTIPDNSRITPFTTLVGTDRP